MLDFILSILKNEATHALGLGILIGVVFGLVRLSPPAPPTLAGVLGVVGIFLGWKIMFSILN